MPSCTACSTPCHLSGCFTAKFLLYRDKSYPLHPTVDRLEEGLTLLVPSPEPVRCTPALPQPSLRMPVAESVLYTASILASGSEKLGSRAEERHPDMLSAPPL